MKVTVSTTGAEEFAQFRTETGSVYELRRRRSGEMSWRRLAATPASGVLRAEEGLLLQWPDITVGARCHLVSEPINPPFTRVVMTSSVVAVLGSESRGQGSREEANSDRASESEPFSEPDEEFVRVAKAAGLPLSRLIAQSKSGYMRRHPQHVAVFNATLTDASGNRLWWGDIDLTIDEEALLEVAERVGFDLYLFHEGDSRRGFVERIDPSRAVIVLYPDRTVELGARARIFRTPFGRLVLRSATVAMPPEEGLAGAPPESSAGGGTANGDKEA